MAQLRTTGLAYLWWVVLAPLGAVVPLTVVSSTDWLAWLRPDAPTRLSLLAALVGGHLLLAALYGWGLRRSLRLARGTPGRARALLLTGGGLLLALASGSLCLWLERAAYALGATPIFGLADFFEVAGPFGRAALGSLVVAFAALLAVVVAVVGSFFLVPLRVRRRLWWVVDGLLLVATVYTSLRFGLDPRQGEPGALIGPSLRLSSTLLLGLRLFVRAVPPLLDLIERVDVRSLVASRHLRAKKSGFLAAISALSILAVTVSCCALCTTLSVMGGFRQDLKRKILGNNAHIVLAPERGAFRAADTLVETLERSPEVVGVSPYVSGEVMVSSASNLAGAVIRGVDPERIGKVTDLPGNMRVGGFEYLEHPEKLLDLPSDVLRLSVPPPPKTRRLADPDNAPSPDGATRLLEDLDRMLDSARDGEEEPAQPAGATPSPPSPAAPKGPTPTGKKDRTADLLPGVIVGQELARSLRLYLGDEVNIVSPLGTLGPSGPMPKSRPFRVAGIFYTGMYEYDMKFLYTRLPTAQRFLSTEDKLHGVEIKIDSPGEAPEVAAELEAAVGRPELEAKPWQELNKNLFGALALERLAMFIALGIAILVASFCIIGTLTLMVQEKGREVAILKAMGARDRAIVGVFVLEGTLIGVFGAALGLALGYALCFAAEHFGIRLNPEVYYIDRLPVHIDPVEFTSVGIAAVLVCLVVTVYPALLASRLRPVEALRYE